MKPQSALGHELIHVKNHVKGKADQTGVKVIDPDTGEEKVFTKDELNTRKEENRIRDEQLDKRRAQPVIVK